MCPGRWLPSLVTESAPSLGVVFLLAPVGPRVQGGGLPGSRWCPGPRPSLGLGDSHKGGSEWTAALAGDPVLALTPLQADVFRPHPAGACAERDVRDRSSAVLLWGATEERKVGQGSESPPCWQGVGTALSPIPVLLQIAASFQLSHWGGENP